MGQDKLEIDLQKNKFHEAKHKDILPSPTTNDKLPEVWSRGLRLIKAPVYR